MTKRILSIVLALLMMINVFAITSFAAESDNHASWKLDCSNESPEPGDVLSIDVSLQADYVTNTFGALIVYDKNYYEPAESVEGNNIIIASDIVDYGNKTVIMSEKKPASVAAKLYDASYTDEMKAQYAIAWFSFVFQASKFGDPTSETIPSYADMTKVATLKLKVKEGAPSDGNGLIWMDPVYIQTANGSAKYTFVARGSNEIVGQCTTAAKFGQTVDVSDAILYKAEEAPACQHTNTTVINAVAATCTEAGYTGDTYCNDCQQIIAQGTVINALNHDFTAQSKDATYLASAATCTADATYYYKCSRCTEKGTTTWTDTNSKLGHDFTVEEKSATYLASPATCTADATYYYKCSRCTEKGTATWTDTNSKLGHDFTVEEKSAEYLASPATCTADATYYYKCSRCTEKGTATWTDTNSVTAHTPGEWTVVTPATCTAKGLQAKYCTVCSALLEQEDIEMSEHVWGDWWTVTPATETQKGLERHECTVCHTTEDRDIPMIVSDNADYTGVEAALANVPADLSAYTTASVQALNDAIQAVVYNLPASQQATVDGYAADIQTAINNLKLIPATLANYADLDDYIAKYVPATSNRTNGVYDADELAAIDELIASFDRQLSSNDQATVDGYLTSLRVAVAALTIDETKAVAEFEITTDKTEAAKDDVITVSLKLKTNYPIYTMQVPVLYDATVFQIVAPNTSVPKSYLTFTGSLADAYKLDGNFNPASSMYKRNSNPSYWSTQTQYKVAYATWAYDVSINNVPVTLEDGEVIATFQLKVISDTADTTGKIFLNSDWIKTATTRGGALAVGRTQGSVISVLDGTKYEIGQTFDLDSAEATVTLNATHEHVRGAWVIEGDKYVCRCTECQEIVESKDLPLATITSTTGTGTINQGTETVINITADALVAKVRIVNAAGNTVSSTITKDGNAYTIKRVFNVTGAEQVYTVQYKLGDTWLDIDTISVNVVKSSVGSAMILSKENTGIITAGDVTKITVATSGDVEKVRVVNSDGNTITADIVKNGSNYVITRTFNYRGANVEQTYTVQYKLGGVWKECGTFSVTVNKKVEAAKAVVTAKTGVGTIVRGTPTTITVSTVSGKVDKVRILKISNNGVVTQVSASNNGVFTISYTFNYTGAEQYYKVQFKSGDVWYDCENGEVTVNVVKEAAPTSTATITETSGVGTIKKGTPTTITVATTGIVSKVRLLKIANNGVVTQVSESDNGVFTISYTFNYTGAEQYYKVQYKVNDQWIDCTDGDITVNVVK